MPVISFQGMNAVHILPAVIFLSVLAFVPHPNHADGYNPAGIEIRNIQALPHVIMTGHLFRINATIVNNSTRPILVENGACDAPFSVVFDKHVLVRKNDIYCTLQMIVHRIDPGSQMTYTAPYSALSYVAQSGGHVNATMTFPYRVWNPENKSYGGQSYVASFSFTIWNMTRVPALSPDENQTLIGTALAIPGLQEWSHDWQYLGMGFGGNNKLGTPYFKWQYALLTLKAPSSSAPVPCNNDWWAWVEIDMETMKVVKATYPTMESHSCQVATGGGPSTLRSKPSGNVPDIKPPIMQFKSGILPNHVTCRIGFQLVIKAEDSSPACASPGTAKKLIERRWGKMPGSTMQQASGMQNRLVNVCGQFYPAPAGNDHGTVPVLLMDSNSTSCARLTFTVYSNYKDCNGRTCQNMVELNSTLHVGDLHYEKHDNMFSVSEGRDYTRSFDITTIPNAINLGDYPVGTSFTVTYVIKPLPNATGFYDHSIPKLACESYPLAVGYAAGQVNASDFDYINTLNPPCAAGVYVLSGVEISGMAYKQVPLLP